jgi:hypothetical protein
MVDALAVSQLDVYDGFATTAGLAPPDAFGPVAIRAVGPARSDRAFTGR